MQTGTSLLISFEKLPVAICPDAQAGSRQVAHIVAECIRDKQARGEMVVLGLATGSSPIEVYRTPVALHRAHGQRSRKKIKFSGDEHCPICCEALPGYLRFMQDRLSNAGNDKRELRKRAEDRNRATAALYDKMGLMGYVTIQAFKRCRF